MLEAAEAPVKKEHDLQIRETRKLVEENLLVMLKLFAGKKQMSLKRREDNDSPEYSHFRAGGGGGGGGGEGYGYFLESHNSLHFPSPSRVCKCCNSCSEINMFFHSYHHTTCH